MVPKFRALVLLVLTCMMASGSGCMQRLRAIRHLSRADHDVEAGDYDQAEREYLAVLRLEPDHPSALGKLGALYFSEGATAHAYVVLLRATKADPDNPAVRLAYGLSALAVHKMPEGRAAASQVLARQPDNEDALVLLADTSANARDIAESRRIIARLRAGHKDAAGYHLAQAEMLLTERKLPEAEDELKRALQLDPKSAAAYGGLASLFVLRGDQRRAEEALKQAAELSPLRSPRRLRYISFLIRTGEIAEAKRRLAEITEHAPDCIPAWAQAMHLAANERDYESCLRDARRILAHDPANYDATLQGASAMLAKGDLDGGLAELKRLADAYRHAPQPQLELAVVYLKRHDSARAEECLNRAIILSPTYDPAIFLLADLNLRKGSFGEVTTAMERLLKRRPGDREALLLLAQAHRGQGSLDQTLAIYRLLAKGYPRSPEGTFLVGAILLELKRPTEARQALEQSAALAPDYWPAQEMLITLDLVERRENAAAERMAGLIQKYPSSASPLLLRARIRTAAGELAGAEADLLKAIELDPASQGAYSQLARLYFHSHREREALDKLAVASARKPGVGVLMQVAVLQASAKEYASARDTYEKLLALDPKFTPALNNLAALYADQLGDREKGCALARRARELAPNNAAVADTLGWILCERGDYDGALPLLRESAGRNPAVPEIQYHLGVAYYMLGQEYNARPALEAAAGSDESVVREDARSRLAILAIDPATLGPATRTDLERQARLAPRDPVVLFRLALAQERSGMAGAAAATYEEVLKLNPSAVRVMVSLARIYLDFLRNPSRARELVRSAHELAPNDPDVSKVLGRILYRTGDFAWSLNLLEAAARAEPNDPALALDLAQGSTSVGRLGEAEARLQPALGDEAAPTVRADARRLASMLAVLKDPTLAPAAAAEARHILAQDPRHLPALMVCALAQERQGDDAGAEQAYRKILAANPLFAPATRQLAILYAEKLDDDRKAFDLALKARQAYPDDPVLAYDLGLLSYRRGEYAPAARYFQQSLRNRANDPETLFYLGMSHYQEKDSAEAKDELQRALQLSLPPQEADEAKRVLDELSQNVSAPRA